ncbi:MAG: endonuclease VIII [Candidatus Sedimenticola sp. (ex Thyasira tokunagai)]
MPEGPEIRRAADTVAEALVGKTASEVWFGLVQCKPFEKMLSGKQVIAIETRGKAMLTHFDCSLSIYSHNQLYGRWYTSPAGYTPDTKRSLRLAIHNDSVSALLYSASDIAVLDKEGVDNHPFLNRLGPDILAVDTTTEMVFSRLQDRRFHRRRLGALLTDQSFVAGLGNYLRCEILFAAELHPAQRPMDIVPNRLHQLTELMLALPRQSYTTRGITNDLKRAEALIADGICFEDARFHLFRRAGKPCYRCGTIIEKRTDAGQACYICPKCQINQ